MSTAYEQYLQSVNNSDSESDSQFDSDVGSLNHNQLDLPVDDFDRFVIRDIDHRSINHSNRQSEDEDDDISIDLDASVIEAVDGEASLTDDDTQPIIERSTNRSIDQSNNQSNDRSVDQSADQSNNASLIAESMLAQYAAEPGLMDNEELEQSINQSVDHSHNQLYNHSNNQSVNQSTNQSIDDTDSSFHINKSDLDHNDSTNRYMDQSTNQPMSSFTSYLSRPSFLHDDEDTPVTRMSTFDPSNQSINPSNPSTPVIPRSHQRSHSNQLSVNRSLNQPINPSPFNHPHYRSPSDFFASKSGNLSRPTFSSPSTSQSTNQLNINTPQKMNQSIAHTPQKINQSINHTPQKLNQSFNQSLNRSMNSMSQPVSPTASIKRARQHALASLTTQNSPRSISRTSHQTINQSIDRLNHELLNQFQNQSIQPITRSLAFDSPARIRVAKPLDQIINQSIDTSNQSVNQSVSQSQLVVLADNFQSIGSSRIKRCYRYIHFDCTHPMNASSMNEQLHQLIGQSSINQSVIRSVLQSRGSNRWTWLLISKSEKKDDLNLSINQPACQSDEEWKQEFETKLMQCFSLVAPPAFVQLTPQI